MTSQPVTDTTSTSGDPDQDGEPAPLATFDGRGWNGFSDEPDQDGEPASLTEPAPLTAFDGPEWDRFAARFLTSRPCERPYRSEW